MTKKRWAILLILISIPLSYYGFSNFEAGSSDPLQAIMISLGCTGGIGCFFGGLYLFFTKEKGRGEDLLASQTSEDSPILNKDKIRQRNEAAIDNLVTKTTDNAIKTLTKKRKVNEMAKAKDTDVANVVEEIRALEELIVQTEERIKKDTLDVKTATETKAVLKDNLARNKTVKESLAIIKQ